MKISAVEEYGLRCLLHVARQDTPIAASSISEAEGISVPYVQKLLRLLTNANLVQSQRGVNGGFKLARPSTSISIGEVMRALGTETSVESVCDKHSGNLESCCHSSQCTIKPVWIHIIKLVVHTLDNLPLSALLGSPDAVTKELDAIITPPVQTFCPVGALTLTDRSHL